MSIRPPRLPRWARRVLRQSVTGAAVLAVVLTLRAVLGWWAVPLLVAAAFVAGVIAGFAAIEARLFDRPRRPITHVDRSTAATPSLDHAAFARAVTAVATAYLSACEREDHRS